MTALHRACEIGDLSKACLLIEKKAEVTSVNSVSIANHIDIVRLLLNVGAAPQQLDYCGRKSFNYLGGDLNREEKKSLMTELKQIFKNYNLANQCRRSTTTMKTKKNLKLK